jgi:uncharacterized membrane protein
MLSTDLIEGFILGACFIIVLIPIYFMFKLAWDTAVDNKVKQRLKEIKYDLCESDSDG